MISPTRLRLARMLSILLPLLLTDSAGASSAKEAHLPTPSYLPELSRQLLRRRMRGHAAAMMDLVRSTILLDREVAREAAGRIASEPRLSRPQPGGEDDLNAMLPEEFFRLQDELHVRAEALEQAAGQKGKNLAAPLAKVVETCTSCHSVYLYSKSSRD